MKTPDMDKHHLTAKYVPSDFPVDRLILEPGFYEVTNAKNRNYQSGDFVENFQLDELNAYIKEFIEGSTQGFNFHFHPFQATIVYEGSILLLTDDWVCQDFAMCENGLSAGNVGTAAYLWQKAIHEGSFIWLRLTVVRSRNGTWWVDLDDSAPVKKLDRKKVR